MRFVVRDIPQYSYALPPNLAPLGGIYGGEWVVTLDLENTPRLGRQFDRFHSVRIQSPSQYADRDQGGISSIRFWRLLVGMPDFTIGGGRYAQLLKSLRRDSRVSRKQPVTMEMLARIKAEMDAPNPQSVGVGCSSVIGFLLLLRVGELGNLRWTEAPLSTDSAGALLLRLFLPRSKTDRYNEGRGKNPQGG